jgi:hypothetical protein
MIIFEKRCPFTGKMNSMEIPMAHREFERAFEAYDSGTLIQDAFPKLTADQREFIMTGITPEKWASIFGSAR